MNISAKDLRSLTKKQLEAKINELRNKQLELRLQVSSQHVAHYATSRQALRKSIARSLMIYNQLQREGGYEG